MEGFSMEKTAIQQRMYQDAADIYKQYVQQDISTIDAFDPLVQMLINACASEFKVFADDILAFKARMLKHLAQMLIPEAYVGAQPAHAILYAIIEDSETITDTFRDEFNYTNLQGKKLYFMPAGQYRLIQGTVKYLVSGNSCFGLKNGNEKSELLQSINAQKLAAGSFWLGIHLSEALKDVSHLTIYFDIPFEVNKSRLEELLATSVWTINGEKLTARPGIIDYKAGKGTADLENLHPVRENESEINNFYKYKFITLQRSDNQAFSSFRSLEFPHEISACFGTSNLQKVLKGETLIWVRADFSQASHSQKDLAELLYQLVAQLNCFPVINRRLYKNTFSIGDDINLFALRMKNEYFYAVEDVKSSRTGKKYLEKPFSQLVSADFEQKKKNTTSSIYALRSEGVQRFDKRMSLDMMENILQIIREETLVYNALGKNILTQNLKTIQQCINDITSKLIQTKTEDDLERKIYISFSAGQSEFVVIQYWSTNGYEARNIPAGEKLKLSDSSRSGYIDQSFKLMSTSTGGRNPVLEKDHLEVFRSALMVRNKIVTEEDIRHYCKAIAGEELESIQVRKNVKIGSGKHTGFIKVINVCIQLREGVNIEHKQYLKQKLEADLNEKSTGILPIEVLMLSNKSEQ